MAPRTVTSAQLLVGTADVSNWFGTISDNPGAVTIQEFAPFGGGGFVQRVAGQKGGAYKFDGWTDHDATGIGNLFTPSNLGTQYGVSVAVPATGNAVATGDWCQFTTGKLNAWAPITMERDSLAMCSMGFETDAAFINSGRVGAPLASRTTAGYTGAAVSLTGPAAGRYMYGILHVTAASGTNLVVKVQSDDNSGFTTPTDRITFSTVSATGWQWGTPVAGSLTSETHWRVIATIATGTFSFAAYFGIA